MKRKDLPPEDVLVAFDEMAWAQRREPEEAMKDVQMFHAGLLSHAVEHVGDLTNRMARRDHIEWDSGIDYVAEKARKILRDLKRPYGFWREHRENVEANVKYRGNITKREYDEELDRLLKVYADAHRRLPVYNRAQLAAREAAIALGEQKPKEAERHLEYLMWLVADEDRYRKASTEFTRNPDGTLVTL